MVQEGFSFLEVRPCSSLDGSSRFSVIQLTRRQCSWWDPVVDDGMQDPRSFAPLGLGLHLLWCRMRTGRTCFRASQ